MLCKVCHYVNETALRSIYYATFQSHLLYVCTAWGQNIKYNHRISILQRKAMKIIFFSDLNEHTTPLLSKAKILKFIDFIQMENCIFVNKSVSDSLHPLFSQVYYLQMITTTTTLHLHQIGLLKIPTNGTSIYGTKSF